jgi:hypothetical protein
MDRKYRRVKNDILLKEKCAECGEENALMLEFAHIDRKNKSFGVAATYSADKVRKEKEKTKMLCVWCHRIETENENIQIRKTRDDYLYTREELNELEDINGKKCKGELCERHDIKF